MQRRSFTSHNQAASLASATHAITPSTGVISAKVVTMRQLNRSGQLSNASAPILRTNRNTKQVPSATVPLRSAPTDKHASTVLPHAAVVASGSTTPIVLRGFGSMRGTSMHTVIIPPPQGTVPNYAKRIHQ